MGHGKGAIPKRKIEKTLRENGYEYVRFNGHYIWKGSNGNTIAIPRTYCTYLVQRVFKENGIKFK